MQVILRNYVFFISRNLFLFAFLSYACSFFFYYFFFYREGTTRVAFLDWKMAQYMVNYFDYGFIKRGFVGTVLYWITSKSYLISFTVVKVTMVISTTSFFLAIIYFINKRLIHSADSFTNAVIRSFVSISPFTAFQFSFDVGRFDIICIFILLCAIDCILKRKFFFAISLCAVGILIHESFVIYALPLVTALDWTIRNNINKNHLINNILKLSIIPLVLIALTFILFRQGISYVNQEIYTLPGGGGIAWYRGVNEGSFGKDKVDTIILSTVILIIYSLLIVFYRANKGNFDALMFASLFPCCLFYFGFDYGRWSAIIFVVVLLTVYIKVVLERWTIQYNSLLYGGFLFLIPLGPVGIGMNSFFPLVKALILGPKYYFCC